MDNGQKWLTSVANRMRSDLENSAKPNPERLTVLELLSKYNYIRRGKWINNHIRNQLDALKLRVDPDFTSA